LEEATSFRFEFQLELELYSAIFGMEKLGSSLMIVALGSSINHHCPLCPLKPKPSKVQV